MASKESILEDKDMENVQLHRAESMINESVILEKIVNEEKQNINPVHEYIGMQVRWVRAKLMQVSAELIMFIYMFSYILRSNTSTVMIMDKVCRVHLGYSEDTCKNLAKYPSVNNEVEKMTNNYHLGHSLLQMAPSAILALFIGSWSDKYGRKPPVILALTGIIMDGFGTIACAYFFNSRVEFYFIPALFTGLSGGFIGVLMVLYSYASDITSADKRTMKYAFMEVAFGISMPLGALAGGWIFEFASYTYVFTLSLCGHILGLLCVVFLLEETTGLNNKDSLWEKFKNFWTLASVVDSFRATIKRRPNQGRKQIWLLILSMSIAIFSFASTMGIMYIYVHHQFQWSNAAYSTVSAVYSVIGLVLLMVIVPISKKKNIGDPVLGIAGSVSLMFKNVGLGLANKVWIYHLASFLGLLSSLGSLAGRARVSKVVSKDDLGKVFAFMTTAECLLPIATTALVSQVFNATLSFFPGLIFVIVGCLLVVPIGVFIWLYRLPPVNYEEMEEKSQKGDKLEKTETTKY